MEKLLARLGLIVEHDLVPYVENGLKIAVILLVAWLLNLLARRLVATFKRFAVARADDPEAARRVETLSRVIRYFIAVVLIAVVGMLILATLGISIAPILGAAGVVGVAVGFGAQSLVKDFFSGFFILLENQVRVGDVVQIAGQDGLVEEVTLRYVRLRSYEGNVHFIPTGMIDKVTNMTRLYSFAVMDVGVAYREDVDQVFQAIRDAGAVLRADPAYAARIVADLELAGVEAWNDSALVVRCRIKTVPLEQWNVRREFLRRLKQAFDQRGIEIPYPHLTLYPGQDKAGGAPALHLRLEKADRPDIDPCGSDSSPTRRPKGRPTTGC